MPRAKYLDLTAQKLLFKELCFYELWWCIVNLLVQLYQPAED